MVIHRGSIWWADLPDSDGSGPGYRRPVVVVQDDLLNNSRLNTVLIAPLTSNLGWGKLPGNLPLSPRDSGLPKPSVVNLTLLYAIDKRALTDHVGRLPARLIQQMDNGLRIILSL
jgi:mRNA interferase MazF